MSTAEFEKSRLRMHRFEEGGVTVQVQWHGSPQAVSFTVAQTHLRLAIISGRRSHAQEYRFIHGHGAGRWHRRLCRRDFGRQGQDRHPERPVGRLRQFRRQILL
ncbi:hypothetical protein AGR7C_Lc120175 [Agrobacterium deltaense Zutra 3/1]|uniref:Uncharacterized protein n=1 Tax=Agrobacterium deltaense Zutra 3/1 TaxID=1183427 RepID=A0A1S7R5K7_9HYPH|nr:hypothetical protein AGR7C_Lc120175 [Agrobacterium deltaense Zutra 3/1]